MNYHDAKMGLKNVKREMVQRTEAPEIWRRLNLARWLNRVSGCSTFNHYNVGDVPAVDVMRINRILEVKENVESYEAKVRNGGK